ncbi:YifB family Mg chelatase-like AAA ATPase [Crocinitomicaceae bacterium]|nr:YifB family Mg chelatase-like AAA ATPase [Crocinitomicaceae bacterium]
MIAKTFGAALLGIDAATIDVEVNIVPGINFFLVGLPDTAVKESHQRIKASFTNNNLKFPGKEITVNLAPADMRKVGSFFDLPIAIGILAASGQVSTDRLEETMFIGELSLDGELRPLKGILPIAIEAKRNKFRSLILPKENAQEACLVDGLQVLPAESLNDVVAHMNAERSLIPERKPLPLEFNPFKSLLDFKDVKGQFSIKRAFEIAAAGGHNLLLIGPPGSGKSMLAKRMPTILPPLSIADALETTKIHSVVGNVKAGQGLIRERPFRKPHHTISDVALVGGGSYPQPGEISLAHNGVLFLDELPEYKRTVLEVMRQPLEDRTVTISRAKFTVDYPANFMLVAAMNPCPCGYYNHPDRDCTCSPGTVQRYLNKVSGPLLDRIDLHVEVTPVDYEDLSSTADQEGSEQIRERVVRARELQCKRFLDRNSLKDESQCMEDVPIENFNARVAANAEMESRHLRRYCQLDKASGDLIKNAMNKLGLSARAYDKILKVARTIADLDGSDDIQVKHVAEAIQYRSLDRGEW